MRLLRAPEDLCRNVSVCAWSTPWLFTHSDIWHLSPPDRDCGHFTSSLYTTLILGCVRQRSRARTLGGWSWITHGVDRARLGTQKLVALVIF